MFYRPMLLSLLLSLPAGAFADNNSLFTLGMGAQYAFAQPQQQNAAQTKFQYGALGRLKLLRFLGVEASVLLDQDPKSQEKRLLSPRYQLGFMLNLIPTDYFHLYGIAGVGAHEFKDIHDMDGETTSFFMGPGLEIFLGEHLALGGDLRFRLQGPHQIKEEIRDEMSPEPVDRALSLEVWQGNFTLSYYF